MKITPLKLYASAFAVLAGWIYASYLKGSFTDSDKSGIVAICIVIFAISLQWENDKN